MNEAEKCCREKGVPDVCFGYCQKESRNDKLRIKDGICTRWFKIIGECRKGKIIRQIH